MEGTEFGKDGIDLVPFVSVMGTLPDYVLKVVMGVSTIWACLGFHMAGFV